MMLTVLTLEHLDLFLEFRKQAPATWKLINHIDDQLIIGYFTNILCGTNNYTVGWIENDRLLAVSCMVPINTRVWVWEYFATVRQKYFSKSLECKFAVINSMFKEALQRKLGTCVFLCRDNFPSITSDAKGSMQKEIASWHDKVPEIKKYTWVDEHRIPANQIPTEPSVYVLMGKTTHQIDLRVRIGYLQQEFRDDEFLKL